MNSEEWDEDDWDHQLSGIEREFNRLAQADLDDEGYNQLETLAQQLQGLCEGEALDLSDDEE